MLKVRSFQEASCANLVTFKIAVLFVLICIESTCHNFERNKIRATGFLKWTDFSQQLSISQLQINSQLPKSRVHVDHLRCQTSLCCGKCCQIWWQKKSCPIGKLGIEVRDKTKNWPLKCTFYDLWIWNEKLVHKYAYLEDFKCQFEPIPNSSDSFTNLEFRIYNLV